VLAAEACVRIADRECAFKWLETGACGPDLGITLGIESAQKK
jgi:hypothetical protein